MERVLVCILSQTRSHQFAWPSFKSHVLDELRADLALAITFDHKYDYQNPYWQHAKYRWTAPEPDDVGVEFDYVQKLLCKKNNTQPADWRMLLDIRGIWLGGIHAKNPQRSFSAHNAIFCKWLLLNGLLTDSIIEKYDRFVITRSDYFWPTPHPPLSILDQEKIWIPDGENYGGICDRHMVISRNDIEISLNIIEGILCEPETLYHEMKSKDSWNPESYLHFYFKRTGLDNRLGFFPYIMYTGRRVQDSSSSWSEGEYEPKSGHIVKYMTEFKKAYAYAGVIKSRADWESGHWKAMDINKEISLFKYSVYESFLKVLYRFYRYYLILRSPQRWKRINQWYQYTFKSR